jgi:hypothetical protein
MLYVKCSRRRRQLESTMTMGLILPRVLPLSSAARRGQHTRASRNARLFFDLYARGGDTSMGTAALDFFACSTR